MCLVRIEKMPKLQTACTVPITEGMVVVTESDEVKQARKSMIELLLGNHPLDCPVCDAGGECELQDMTFKYGAAESRYMEGKLHKEEQQWSPVVFFDRPRCILCYRCVRVCAEGMDVAALGIQNRGSGSVIAPNEGDHLDCEECGMCIDICPVGALTSGAYRYKTRPWEMNHVGTICTHCGDGCKTTLGVRRCDTGMEIVRADNRDKGGINGDFLCIKGRYAFDFANHADRLTQPLIRRKGKLTPVSWDEAISHIARRFREIRDLASAPAILLIGNDPTEQHPLLAWNIRTTVRLNQSKLFVVNANDIKLRRQAASSITVPEGREGKAIAFLNGDDSAAGSLTGSGGSNDSLKQFRDQIKAQKGLIIIFGSELKGEDVTALVNFGAGLGAKFICLGDYSNSRGAADMGLTPDLLPGYVSVNAPGRFAAEWVSLPKEKGLGLSEMFEGAKQGRITALSLVGSNPVVDYSFDPAGMSDTFIVVQDLFMTETAMMAEVVLPAASSYEKAGTFTNTCGDL